MTSVPEQIAEGVRLLRAGELVAFPTETVYGLGADALSPPAIERVFALKGRPRRNPLIVHVSDQSMARTLAPGWADIEDRLARAFWPGPLTIVAEAAALVPVTVRAGGPTVALRCPDHPITLALIESFGGPIVGPSANRSGDVSPTTPDHVRAAFPDLFIIDGGPCRGGIESTVIAAAPGRISLLRPGLITADEIAAVTGLPVSPALNEAAEGPLAAPGRLPRHYAPRTPARLLTRDEIALIADRPLAILALSEFEPAPGVEPIAMPHTARAYAASLYHALRLADAHNAAVIAIERPPTSGPEAALWAAILDRLARATSHEPA